METTIGERIRALRQGKGMTLETLAQSAKISKAYLSQLENGDSERPSAEILYNIALTLNTSIANLLGKEFHPAVDSEEKRIPALEQAALKYSIPTEFVKKLAALQMRNGAKEYSQDDWAHLYMTLKSVEERQHGATNG